MVWKLADLCLKCVQQNLEHYPDVGKYLPTQYKELLIYRLSCHERFFPESLPHIYSNIFSNRLRHIKLESTDQISDVVLQHLGDSGCRLETLSLKRLANVTDAGVIAVTKGQDCLTAIHFKNLKQITQKAISCIASPKLWSFKLKQSLLYNKQWCTQAALADFFSKNPSIRRLRLDVNIDKLPTIARGLGPSLQHLDSQLQSANDEYIEVLAECCPNLKSLDLNGAKYVGREALIKLFQACTQLSKLDLGYCSRLAAAPENEVLWILPQSLTSLSLWGLMLEDSGILVDCVTRLKHIKELKLSGVPCLDDGSLNKILEKIGSKLVSLSLSGVWEKEVTDEGLKSVAKYCTNLESFYISLLRKVTGTTLRPIFSDPARASRIKNLSINSKQLDVSVLEEMMSCFPNLETLDLSGLSFVTNDMIISLADHSPNLLELHLKGCNQVTDTAICHLSGCCPLKCLGLSGLHTITDKSIFCLASSCPQMEEIYLNGCANISPVAVQYLKDCCLNRLLVKHNIPNASPNQLMARNLDTGEFCRVDVM